MNDKQIQSILDLLAKQTSNATYGAGGYFDSDEMSDILDEIDIPQVDGERTLSDTERVRYLVDLVKKLKLDNLEKLKKKL